MKYKNLARAEQNEKELEELERKYREENGEAPVVEQDPDPVVTKEDETWKERYGNLKSYVDKTLKKEIADLKTQLAAKPAPVMEVPENVDEARAWVSKYPALSGILKTLWKEDIDMLREEIGPQLAELEEEKQKIAWDRAFAQVVKAHPDFPELIQDPDFIQWVENHGESGDAIGQAIYKALNSVDAVGSIRAVNIYKQELKEKARPEREKKTSRSAAETVPNRVGSKTPTEINGKPVFAESQIEKMSIRDYEKFEDAIDEAKREGRFVYDVTGAAR